MRQVMLAAVVLGFVGSFAVAQDRPRPPVLRAQGVDKPLSIEKADVRVMVVGTLARTTMTLTFRNDTNRVLEGELTFPLPEGVTVSGFGLDVNGVVVDGVPVEKEQARITFEKEVRKGVDPGLVEQVAGNNYRTRVYPIPANGTRSVKIEYVADLVETKDGPACVVPMNWSEVIKTCTVRVESVEGELPRIAGGALAGVDFKKAGGTLVAEKTIENAKVSEDLVVLVPDLPKQQAVVEKRTKRWVTAELDDAGKPRVAREQAEHFFLIGDLPPADARRADAAGTARAGRVGIAWDASLSRSEADKKRELDLVRKLLEKEGSPAVDVIVFRDRPEDMATSLTPAAALDLLSKVTYDGATNLGELRLLKNVMEYHRGQFDEAPADYAYWLLFTDGLSDLGRPVPAKLAAPVYTISNDARSNHALLRRIATMSGGTYLNLSRVEDDQALATIGRQPFSLVSVQAAESEVTDIYPSGATPVNGRVMVSGRLIAPRATITLNYGYGNIVTHKTTLTLRQAGALETGLVPKFWAQQKVAELSVFSEESGEEVLATGKEFGIVTPNTSLIVLERIEQYVQYKITPPGTLPEMVAQYMDVIEKQAVAAKQTREERVGQVLAMWDERVKWWEAEYKYPAGLQYVEKQAEQGETRTTGGPGDEGGLQGYARHYGGGAPMPQSRTAAPTTPPPAPVAVQPERSVTPGPAGTRNDQAPLPLVLPRPRMEGTPRPLSTGQARPAEQGGSGGQGANRAMPRNQLGTDGTDRFYGTATDVTAGGREARLDGDLKANKGDGPSDAATILIKPWDPNTPYLAAMKKGGPDEAYAIYLDQRKAYKDSPAFYFDCAEYFFRNDRKDLGVRVLSNVAELRLENAALLRVVAHRLNQIGRRELAIDLFRRILTMRREEPQSYRDLALVLADRADASPSDSTAGADYAEAIKLLTHVVMNKWDRFDGVEVIALMEANRILPKLSKNPPADWRSPLDSRLTRPLDLDVRIVMTWDADLTDIDLWVTEPSGEKCLYNHNRTTIGGLMSKDFTQGYGPEEYCLRKAMPGPYTIEANFYGSSQQSLQGATTVQATVITNFGRPDEKRQSLTLRLTDKKESQLVGKVTIGKD